MILVAHEKGSKELAPIIQQIGIKAEIVKLPFGDFAFEGQGPSGTIAIGIERKTLHDLLMCIDDGRYSGHQKIGMDQLYTAKYLFLEGIWKPHENGVLMEGRENGQFWVCKPGGKPVMYSKLRRFLFSVGLSGVTVTQTRNMFQTAYDICELYHYYQKPWHEHNAMQQMCMLNIPSLTKPSLTREWAARLPGVGVELSERVERQFNTPRRLANSEPSEWIEIPGIGKKKAEQIVKEIIG